MLGDFADRGFVVGLAADLAHPRGWFDVATIAGGDLPDDHEHTIRAPAPFLEAFGAFAAAQGLARLWIDQPR
jgi:hypothetical protein